MAKQVQRRRGTAAENDAFTGAEGEVTVDTTANDLRVHDGSTEGGHPAGSVAVSAHNDDTTSVHGIADTSALETQAGAQGKVDAHAALTDNPHGVTAAQAGADPAGTASTAVSTHNSAADAHGARLPPTPVGEADGRILTVASDALVYADAAGGGIDNLTRALVAPDARLWPVYESGLRDVEVETSAIGLAADSGQLWEAPTRGGVTSTLFYAPPADPAPMRASVTTTGSRTLNDQPFALLPGPDTTTRVVEVTWLPSAVATWPRYLVLNYVDEDNILALRASNVAWSILSLVAGVETTLLSTGGAAEAHTGSQGLHKITASLHYVHGSASAVNRAVSFSIDNGALQRDDYRVGLPEGHEVFRDNAGKVGFGVPHSTYIWSFTARRGFQ